VIQQERLVKTFCDIVRIDSPSGEEEAVAQDLARRLKAWGFTILRDAHGNLIANEPGDNPLLLSAHMDTVEPGRGVKPRVVEGRIISDGATILGGDCKAGLAAILEALESLHEERKKRRPAQLVFTRGEELGLVGAKYLDMSMLKAKEGVVFDGNGPVSKITTASPTYMSLDVKVTGRAAHAGVEPEKGLSAIRIASDIITSLPQGRLDQETTFNVGTIKGGNVRNTVPDNAVFVGEFRSRNVETLDLLRLQTLEVIDKARKKYRDAKIEDELKVEFQMYALSPDDPMVARTTKLLTGIGLRPDPGPSGGGTDANVLNREGIKCVVVGMSTNEMHTVREHVYIKDLVDTARFCRELLVQR